MKFKITNPATGITERDLSTLDVIRFATSPEARGAVESLEERLEELESVLATVVDALPNKDDIIEKIAALSFMLKKIE